MAANRNIFSLLHTLSSRPRLAILAHLRRKNRGTVSDIARAIQRSAGTTSVHLAHLERQGIIERRRRGREVLYRLSLPQHPMTKQVLKEL